MQPTAFAVSQQPALGKVPSAPAASFLARCHTLSDHPTQQGKDPIDSGRPSCGAQGSLSPGIYEEQLTQHCSRNSNRTSRTSRTSNVVHPVRSNTMDGPHALPSRRQLLESLVAVSAADEGPVSAPCNAVATAQAIRSRAWHPSHLGGHGQESWEHPSAPMHPPAAMHPAYPAAHAPQGFGQAITLAEHLGDNEEDVALPLGSTMSASHMSGRRARRSTASGELVYDSSSVAWSASRASDVSRGTVGAAAGYGSGSGSGHSASASGYAGVAARGASNSSSSGGTFSARPFRLHGATVDGAPPSAGWCSGSGTDAPACNSLSERGPDFRGEQLPGAPTLPSSMATASSRTNLSMLSGSLQAQLAMLQQQARQPNQLQVQQQRHFGRRLAASKCLRYLNSSHQLQAQGLGGQQAGYSSPLNCLSPSVRQGSKSGSAAFARLSARSQSGLGSIPAVRRSPGCSGLAGVSEGGVPPTLVQQQQYAQDGQAAQAGYAYPQLSSPGLHSEAPHTHSGNSSCEAEGWYGTWADLPGSNRASLERPGGLEKLPRGRTSDPVCGLPWGTGLSSARLRNEAPIPKGSGLGGAGAAPNHVREKQAGLLTPQATPQVAGAPGIKVGALEDTRGAGGASAQPWMVEHGADSMMGRDRRAIAVASLGVSLSMGVRPVEC